MLLYNREATLFRGLRLRRWYNLHSTEVPEVFKVTHSHSSWLSRLEKADLSELLRAGNGFLPIFADALELDQVLDVEIDQYRFEKLRDAERASCSAVARHIDPEIKKSVLSQVAKPMPVPC